MKIKLLTILNIVCFFAIHSTFAQQKSNLSGTVKDLENQSFIAGATVKLNNNYTTKTDSLGFYRFTDIPAGTYNATASAISYQTLQKFNIVLSSGNENEMNFELNSSATQLNEVSVVSNIKSAQATSIVTPLSIQKLTAEEIKSNPGGNFDISRVVNTLPGISGSSGIVGGYRNDIIIRGGGPGENVYYLDGIEIPVINHFATQGSGGGPTGILNVSFIDEVKLSSSAFDSKFDNVLSGVLEFKQRNGNINKTQSNFRLSGTELAGTLEGPLGKSKKVSYLASVRRSYLQALFSLIDLPIRPNYWDFQFKVNYQLSKKTTVNVLGVGAIDQFGFGAIKEPTQEKIYTLFQVPANKQKSYTVGTSIKHLINDGYLFATLSRNVLNNDLSKYENNDDSNTDNLRFSNQGAEIENKARFEIVKNMDTWRWNFGSMLQYVSYDIANNFRLENTNQRIMNQSAISFWKYGLFAQISKKLFDEKLSLTLGVRSDGNSFTTENTFVDGLSPKFAFSYEIAPKWSMSGSIGRYAKVPSYTLLGFRDANNNYVNEKSNYIHSTHYVLGTAFSPRSSTRFTFETFYKHYQNLPISSSTGINLNNLGADYGIVGNEPAVFNGEGESYGFEVFAQQKLSKKFFGLVSFTYYYSNYRNADGKWLPGAFDNRYMLSTTLGYKFPRNWELGLKMRFQGGAPYTPFDLAASQTAYLSTGKGVLDYSQFNSLRLASFSSGDIRVTKRWNFKKFTLDLYADASNFWIAPSIQYPQYTFERNLTTQQFKTTDGNALKADGSNAIPAVLNDTKGILLPTIGFIIEL